ncbi:hypothetical protein DFH28DRAFT_960047 [Melampsora americana]|nr:hypothetical protein DFH28DRAFT_960047 [Melampsora americana]
MEQGHVRICSKTQGIALSLGDKISLLQRFVCLFVCLFVFDFFFCMKDLLILCVFLVGVGKLKS